MLKNPFSWVIILLPLITVIVFTRTDIGSPNDASRIATIQSLVEYHTFALDSVNVREMVDIMRRSGHFYSDKPPMLQVLGAIVYYPFYSKGFTFSHYSHGIYYFITLILVGIPFVIICFLLYKIFLIHELEKQKLIVLFVFTWLGTILLPYSITFNNHLLTACLILCAAYLYIQAEIYSKPIKQVYLWQGFLLSLALTLEFPTGGICFLGFLFLIYYRKRALSCIGAYLLGAAIPLFFHFLFNYYQTGDLIPAYLHKEFYHYPGSVWGGELGKKRLFGKNLLGQYFHMLFGYRGIFLFSPFLFLGFIESLRIANKRNHPYRELSLITLLIFIGTISSYAIQISDFGGGSYGLRWVIAVIPLFIFFTALWMKRNLSKLKWMIVIILLLVSVTFSCIGLYNPWPENILSPSPILENIAYMAFYPKENRTQLTEWIIENTSLEKGFSYYELARACRAQGDFPKAVQYFENSLKYDPNHALTYYHLGITLDQINQPGLAIPVYEKLLQLDPENIGAMNNFGISLLRVGEYKKAEEIYRKSIEKDSNRFISHYGLAQSLSALKMYPEAMEEIKICLRLNPESVDAQDFYGKLKYLVKTK